MRNRAKIVLVIVLVVGMVVLGALMKRRLSRDQVVAVEVVSHEEEAFLFVSLVSFEWDYRLWRWVAEWLWERVSRLHAVLPTTREKSCYVWHINSSRSLELEVPLRCFDAVIPGGGEVFLVGKDRSDWRWTGESLVLASEEERHGLNEIMVLRSMSVDGTEWNRQSNLLPEKNGATVEDFGPAGRGWSLVVKRKGFENPVTDRGGVTIAVVRKGQKEEILRVDERYKKPGARGRDAL
jgi:hypothetical protein